MNTLVRSLFLFLRALPVEASKLLARPLLGLLFLPYIREIERNRRRFDGRRGSWGFWLRNAWRLGEHLALMLQIGKPGDRRFIDRVAVEGERYLRDSLNRHKIGRAHV